MAQLLGVDPENGTQVVMFFNNGKNQPIGYQPGLSALAALGFCLVDFIERVERVGLTVDRLATAGDEGPAAETLTKTRALFAGLAKTLADTQTRILQTLRAKSLLFTECTLGDKPADFVTIVATATASNRGGVSGFLRDGMAALPVKKMAAFVASLFQQGATIVYVASW